MDIEKMLSEAKIYLADTPEKQGLLLLALVCKMHENCTDDKTRMACESYFTKFLKAINAMMPD